MKHKDLRQVSGQLLLKTGQTLRIARQNRRLALGLLTSGRQPELRQLEVPRIQTETMGLLCEDLREN